MKYKTLYLLYFVLVGTIILNVVTTFTHGDFKTGFKEGQHDARRVLDKDDFSKTWHAWELPLETEAGIYDITIPTIDSSSTKVSGRITTLDLLVTSDGKVNALDSKQIFSNIILFILTFILITVLVLITILFINIKSSLKNSQIFAKDNYILMRILGAILVVQVSLEAIYSHLVDLSAAEILMGTKYSVITEWKIDFTLLILGVSILFISQVFKEGYIIEEEQKLTV